MLFFTACVCYLYFLILLLYFSSSFVSRVSHLCGDTGDSVPVSSVADGRQSAAEKNKVITNKGWSESPLQPVCAVHVVYSLCGFFFVIFGLKNNTIYLFLLFPNLNFPKTSDILEIMFGVLLTSLTYLLWGFRLIVGVICIIVGSLPGFCCGLTLYK